MINHNKMKKRAKTGEVWKRYVKAMWEDKKTRQRRWKKWQNYREIK